MSMEDFCMLFKVKVLLVVGVACGVSTHITENLSTPNMA